MVREQIRRCKTSLNHNEKGDENDEDICSQRLSYKFRVLFMIGDISLSKAIVVQCSLIGRIEKYIKSNVLIDP